MLSANDHSVLLIQTYLCIREHTHYTCMHAETYLRLNSEISNALGLQSQWPCRAR